MVSSFQIPGYPRKELKFINNLSITSGVNADNKDLKNQRGGGRCMQCLCCVDFIIHDLQMIQASCWNCEKSHWSYDPPSMSTWFVHLQSRAVDKLIN